MIYPINIFSPDPTSGSIRPFIIFIANEYKPNIFNAKSWRNALPMMVPKGGFVLPMPNGGLVDSVTHDYGTANPFMDKLSSVAYGVASKEMLSFSTGAVIDPMMTQVYKGTSPRKWSGTWQLVPQSMAESIAIALILHSVKRYGSPDKKEMLGKVGILIQPLVFKIIFSNPLIHFAMRFDKMALESYSINYFAQGYASTYSDMMPKHIELTLSFGEYGIKSRSDWSKIWTY
jgi:hypothetical protein